MNFKKKFHGKVFDDHLWPAAYSWTPRGFDYHMAAIEEKKAAAAKKAEPKVSAVIQCSAGQVTVEDLTAAAARAYKEAHEGAEIENITIYIKPEENAVYYVVNGDDSEGNNKLALI